VKKLFDWLGIAGLTVALGGARCANPCTDFAERVCEDLGPEDCELWRSDPAISQGMLPGEDYKSRRGGAAITTCRLWNEDENYAKATLPTVRWRIANARDPGRAGPMPALAAMKPPNDPLGVPPSVYYLLPPLIIAFGFLRWRMAMRRVKTAQSTVKTWQPPE
jgi:hypothetical protein